MDPRGDLSESERKNSLSRRLQGLGAPSLRDPAESLGLLAEFLGLSTEHPPGLKLRPELRKKKNHDRLDGDPARRSASGAADIGRRGYALARSVESWSC